MKTALITGATGFVGGALARSLLRDDYRVVAICRDGDPPKGCHVIRGDITDLQTCVRAVTEARPDAVYHLAAQAIVGHAKTDPFNTFESNVRGTYTLLEACRLQIKSPRIVPIVVASSDKAYGWLREGGEYVESDPLKGEGFYDCSKSITDMIAGCYGRDGLSVTVIRAGNIYGPGDSDMTRIVPSLIDDAINGRELVIMSDGTPVRDYLYIDDAVRAYRYAADYARDGGGHREFNISGGEPVTVLQLAERLQRVMKRSGGYNVQKIKILGHARMDEIPYQVLNTSRAREALDFVPYTNLDEGLAITLSYAFNKAGK